MTQRSARPFPLRGGPVNSRLEVPLGVVPGQLGYLREKRQLRVFEVPPSHVPHWLAEIFYARLLRIAGPGAGMVPTLEDSEREGGFTPLGFVDVLSGGTGDGRRWTWLETRRAPLVEQELLAVPFLEDPPSLSSAPFPIQGTRIDDGTGVEAGFIPEWLAASLARRMRRWTKEEHPTLEDWRRAGGPTPLEVLDLLLGGRGDGLAHRIVEKRWVDERAMTDLERGLLEDAGKAPARAIVEAPEFSTAEEVG